MCMKPWPIKSKCITKGKKRRHRKQRRKESGQRKELERSCLWTVIETEAGGDGGLGEKLWRDPQSARKKKQSRVIIISKINIID